MDGVAPTMMMMMMKDCLPPFPTPTDYSSYSDFADVDWAVDQHGAIAMKALPHHCHYHHYPLTFGVVIFDGNAAVPLYYALIYPYFLWHMPSLGLLYRLHLSSIARAIGQFQDTS